ncbi:hypothetical protein [Sphingomonas sp. Leaf25]|uniref:hypothetical protein n=1 Tax=Sphingomonas sp. Leaf25 TaxID=1735692 RepID=UPI0006FE4308|nr:hypothetical protein [Sphingomonas sp. Leaf25]KQM98358.1 hypothetical protein ASE78_09000 [Sphingomonas sp. Leaf25]
MKLKTGRIKNTLRRYTTIGSAIDTLRNKRVAFLDPEKWDDRNDAEFMRLYREKMKLASLKALCCTESGETYHHWKVFTQSADGCCIDFEKKPLLHSIKTDDDYFYASMDYVRLDEMKDAKYTISDLPFLKRAGFKPELEYRIIYTGECGEGAHFMPIELRWIKRIVLNPWLPPSVAKSIAETLVEASGDPEFKVASSKLTNSQLWIKWGKRIAKQAAEGTNPREE